MPLKLGAWTSPRGEERLYINGLPTHSRFDKVWTTCALWPQLESFGIGPEGIHQAASFITQWPTWDDAWRSAQGLTPSQPVNPPPGNPSMPPRSMFESSHIAHVAACARMAGIAFRNGLTKGEIIDRILSSPEAAQRAAEFLARLRDGEKPSPPAPDWLNDPNPFTPAPVPAPKALDLPPVAQPSIDLSEYAKRTDLRNAVRPINASLEALETLASETRDEAARVAAKVAELQAMRPLALHFPEKPAPILINGLRHPLYPELLRALRARINCALIGGAGSGKTTATEQAARDLGLTYYKEKPFTASYEVLGHLDTHNRYHRTPTREAVENGGLICFDEADRSSPDALVALNAVLDASDFVSFPDGLIRKHADFVAVWAGNTDGSGATMSYASAQRQDGSTLDRVAMFDWEVDPRIEDQMAQGETQWLAAVREIRAFILKRGILDVVGTPRATKHGATLLRNGMARELVLAVTCKRGAMRECWRDVEALPAVRAFLKG